MKLPPIAALVVAAGLTASAAFAFGPTDLAELRSAIAGAQTAMRQTTATHQDIEARYRAEFRKAHAPRLISIEQWVPVILALPFALIVADGLLRWMQE